MELMGKTDEENGPKTEKNQTEIATGLGRRTNEEIYKSGIKLTALRFPTGARHQKCPASLRGIQWVTYRGRREPRETASLLMSIGEQLLMLMSDAAAETGIYSGDKHNADRNWDVNLILCTQMSLWLCWDLGPCPKRHWALLGRSSHPLADAFCARFSHCKSNTSVLVYKHCQEDFDIFNSLI